MIAFIDLDNFKLIKIVLVIIVAICFSFRLASALNAGEVIGRLGGDEFLVVSLNTRMRIFRRCENVFNNKYAEKSLR